MREPARSRCFPLTYMNASAIPADVLADGRILFESGFPLGEGTTPELFLVYSDGSGVESYRCDHPPKPPTRAGEESSSSPATLCSPTAARSARFTSPLAHEEHITAPSAEYAGGIAETASGEWLVSAPRFGSRPSSR